jgi:hypothetical protein
MATAATLVIAASAITRHASADEESMAALRGLPRPGWYLPVGVNTGLSGIGAGSLGAIVGAEASVVNLAKYYAWYGAYADVGYITNTNALRFSVGPEIGLWFFGVDGGFLDIVENGRSRTGYTIRPLLTLGAISIYGRWDHTFENGGVDSGQIGLLLKYPIPLEGQEIRF